MIEVLVAGGGPTGLAVANALGQLGVGVMLVEQEPGVAGQPRAVSVDDEAMRLMQSLGLLEQARRVVLPGTGTRYYGARGQLLAHARGGGPTRHGHPVKNPMDHPEFQRMLLEGLHRFPGVDARHRTRLVSFEQDGEGITATLDGEHGAETVRCRYLVGADGGRSVVRRLLGQEPMPGHAFEQRWLVLDTINDRHDQRYAMHHGDPRRPRVVIVGRGGRCRYEFLVHDHEQPEGDDAVLALARELVSPYRTLEPADVVRCTIYRFYALVAETFSDGRAFLAGDAAHMMPPFAGQGLNSGLRDAANLSWKLAAVLQGRAGPELLDTYTVERRPHVIATVDLSVRRGSVMMTRSRARAFVRDVAFSARRLPVIGRALREPRLKPEPIYEAGLVVPAPDVERVVGRTMIQSTVLDRDGQFVPIDDVIGPGFGLLAIDMPGDAFERLAAPLWRRLMVTRVHVRLGEHLPRAAAEKSVAAHGALAEQLGDLEGRFVLVRPDRFIAAAFAPAEELRVADQLRHKLGAPAPRGVCP